MIKIINISITLIILIFVCLYSGKTGETKENTSYKAQDPLDESIKRGEVIYNEYCMQCHLGKGEGISGIFPPLAKSNWLLPEKREAAIAVVKYGQSGEMEVNGVTYNGVMTKLGLYDDEVADVMNYILNNWGNSSDKIVTEEEVKEIKKP